MIKHEIPHLSILHLSLAICPQCKVLYPKWSFIFYYMKFFTPFIILLHFYYPSWKLFECLIIGNRKGHYYIIHLYWILKILVVLSIYVLYLIKNEWSLDLKNVVLKNKKPSEFPSFFMIKIKPTSRLIKETKETQTDLRDIVMETELLLNKENRNRIQADVNNKTNKIEMEIETRLEEEKTSIWAKTLLNFFFSELNLVLIFSFFWTHAFLFLSNNLEVNLEFFKEHQTFPFMIEFLLNIMLFYFINIYFIICIRSYVEVPKLRNFNEDQLKFLEEMSDEYFIKKLKKIRRWYFDYKMYIERIDDKVKFSVPFFIFLIIFRFTYRVIETLHSTIHNPVTWHIAPKWLLLVVFYGGISCLFLVPAVMINNTQIELKNLILRISYIRPLEPNEMQSLNNKV